MQLPGWWTHTHTHIHIHTRTRIPADYTNLKIHNIKRAADGDFRQMTAARDGKHGRSTVFEKKWVDVFADACVNGWVGGCVRACVRACVWLEGWAGVSGGHPGQAVTF